MNKENKKKSGPEAIISDDILVVELAKVNIVNFDGILREKDACLLELRYLFREIKKKVPAARNWSEKLFIKNVYYTRILKNRNKILRKIKLRRKVLKIERPIICLDDMVPPNKSITSSAQAKPAINFDHKTVINISTNENEHRILSYMH